MVDKIVKVLNKLSDKERQKVKEILIKIKANNYSQLDLKKLKGRDDVYRVRKGKLRIIFLNQDGNIKILVIERRSEITYK